MVHLKTVPHTTSQRLAPELAQSLVSIVVAEVTRQLTATLPTLASQLRPPPPLATRNASELAEEPTSTHDVSATTPVEGAIAAAQSRITGALQLLPSTSVVTPLSNPSQIFISADLPMTRRCQQKLRRLSRRLVQ